MPHSVSGTDLLGLYMGKCIDRVIHEMIHEAQWYIMQWWVRWYSYMKKWWYSYHWLFMEDEAGQLGKIFRSWTGRGWKCFFSLSPAHIYWLPEPLADCHLLWPPRMWIFAWAWNSLGFSSGDSEVVMLTRRSKPPGRKPLWLMRLKESDSQSLKATLSS